MDHETATDEQVALYCSDAVARHDYISRVQGGASIVKISSDAVVKFGSGIKEHEAKAQERAYRLIDPAVVRVPRLYRFFTISHRGYIIMEYIHGKVLQDPEPAVIKNIVAALAHFAQIRSENPGPLAGGPTRGPLWSDYHDFIPATIKDVEHYFNQRKRCPEAINLSGLPVVLCHGDVAPRNILVLPDSSICIIDWESAGFYPRLFETCALRLNVQGSPDDPNEKILASIAGLTTKEEAQASAVGQTCLSYQRYI